MFIRKLEISGLVGSALAIVLFIMSLKDGHGFVESLGVVPGSMLVALVAVFWFTRNMDEDGNELLPSTDQRIDKLQRQLRFAIESAIYNETHGNRAEAAHFRARAAQIESELRRMGA